MGRTLRRAHIQNGKARWLMGTRADFYVGRGEGAEWLGSFAWDGYRDGTVREVLGATTEDDFRARVASLLAGRKDGTTPDMGWPWPWEDGRLTDYSYAFDAGKVWVSAFGHAWFDPADPPEDVHAGGKVVFPDMTARRRVTLGERSGLMVFQASDRKG